MNFFSFVAELNPSVSQKITWLILHSLWQGAAVAVVIFLLNTVMWKQSAKLRYTIAVGGLLAMFCTVIATWSISDPTSSVTVDATSTPVVFNAEAIAAVVEPGQFVMNEVESVEIPSTPMAMWAPLASAIYLVGVAVMLLRLVFSAIGINRLRMASLRVNDQFADQVNKLAKQIGVRIEPSLKTCERVVIPFVTGVFKPAILLPTFATSGMTHAELDAILLHELAHIRRGDLLVNLLQRIAESFLFFHPAVWYISRVITIERENCCDDIVLSQCSQKTYASALIRLAETCTGKLTDTTPLAGLAATGAGPSQLKRRIERILGVSSAPRFRPSIGVLLACFFAVAITAVHLRAQTPDRETQKTNINADLSLRAPLVVRFDQQGKVSDFTVYTMDKSIPEVAQRDRFNEILKQLQTDKRVSVDLTRVRRRTDGSLAMTVAGANLEIDAIRTAVRDVDTPSQESTVELKSQPGNAKEIELEGPLRIEFVDDSDAFVVRGKKEDVDRVMELIERTKNEPNAATGKEPETKKAESKKQANSQKVKHGRDFADSPKYAYSLKNITAEAAKEVLLTFLPQHKEDIHCDANSNTLFLSDNIASEQRTAIKKILDRMERMNDEIVSMNYDLRWEPSLKALFNGADKVRFATDSRAKTLIVSATIATHQKIRKFVGELEVATTRAAWQHKLIDEREAAMNALRGDSGTAGYKPERGYEIITMDGGRYVRLNVKPNPTGSTGTPKSALRFPIEVERAMMGDIVVPKVLREGEWSTFDSKPQPMLFPEEIERGMQIDAIEGGGKRR